MSNHSHNSRGELRACTQCAGSPEAAAQGAKEQRSIDATMYGFRRQGVDTVFELAPAGRRGPSATRAAQRAELQAVREEMRTDPGGVRKRQREALQAARKALRG